MNSELNLPPGSDENHEPQTVKQFLDSLVEEIHISDDEFQVDYSLFDDENKEQLDVSKTRSISAVFPVSIVAVYAQG